MDPILEQIKEVRSGVDKTASELAIKRLEDDIKKIRAGIPEDNPGCVGKIGNLCFGIAFCSLILGGLGALSGESVYIVGGLISAAVFITLGVFTVKATLKQRDEVLNPYLEKIAKVEKDIEYHKRIVDKKEEM